MTSPLGRFVFRSLEFVQSQQLFSGELVCVQRLPHGAATCACPIAATFVRDSLSFIDPSSLACEWRVIDFIPTARRRKFAAIVAGLRWRLRSYIASEQNCDGSWHFYGRQSSLRPDLATTACAATELWRSEPAHIPRKYDANFWRRLGTHDLYAAAQMLRFVGLTGIALPELEPRVCDAIDGSKDLSIFELQAVARAWRGGPESDRVRNLLVSKLLNLRTTDPLQAALKTSALLDLDFADPILQDVASFLDNELVSDGLYETFCDRGVASPAVTAALILANTIRIAAQTARPWN